MQEKQSNTVANDVVVAEHVCESSNPDAMVILLKGLLRTNLGPYALFDRGIDLDKQTS